MSPVIAVPKKLLRIYQPVGISGKKCRMYKSLFIILLKDLISADAVAKANIEWI